MRATNKRKAAAWWKAAQFMADQAMEGQPVNILKKKCTEERRPMEEEL